MATSSCLRALPMARCDRSPICGDASTVHLPCAINLTANRGPLRAPVSLKFFLNDRCDMNRAPRGPERRNDDDSFFCRNSCLCCCLCLQTATSRAKNYQARGAPRTKHGNLTSEPHCICFALTAKPFKVQDSSAAATSSLIRKFDCPGVRRSYFRTQTGQIQRRRRHGPERSMKRPVDEISSIPDLAKLMSEVISLRKQVARIEVRRSQIAAKDGPIAEKPKNASPNVKSHRINRRRLC